MGQPLDLLNLRLRSVDLLACTATPTLDANLRRPTMSRLRLHVDEDDNQNEPAPQPLPFPKLWPDEDCDTPQASEDLAEALEATIERMKQSLDDLADDLDDVFRMPAPGDEPPTAA